MTYFCLISEQWILTIVFEFYSNNNFLMKYIVYIFSGHRTLKMTFTVTYEYAIANTSH